MMGREIALLTGLLLLIGQVGSVAAEKRISNSGGANLSDEVELENEIEPQMSKLGIPIGSFTVGFGGFDMQERAIWLNDYRYELYPGYKVIGKRLKRERIESIQEGEMVQVFVKENRKNPMTPYLVEIKRSGE